MSKNKGKNRGTPSGQSAPSFNEDALAQLTSKIDKNLIAGDHKRKNHPTNSSPGQSAKKQKNSDTKPPRGNDSEEIQALLAEIKALGGDEADLELIDGIESDEEMSKESSGPVDKKLRDELAAFSKELGFAQVQPTEASDEEVAEEQDDEEDEAESEEEEDDSDDDGAEAQKSEKIPESRKMGNMVGPTISRHDIGTCC